MNKRFSPEVRERAVRMVSEHVSEYSSQWEAICSIAEKIGCSAETLRKWVRQAEVDQGERQGLTTSELGAVTRTPPPSQEPQEPRPRVIRCQAFRQHGMRSFSVPGLAHWSSRRVPHVPNGVSRAASGSNLRSRLPVPRKRSTTVPASLSGTDTRESRSRRGYGGNRADRARVPRRVDARCNRPTGLGSALPSSAARRSLPGTPNPAPPRAATGAARRTAAGASCAIR